MRLDAEFVLSVTGAVMCGPEPTATPFSMVTVDSRQCKPGALFACLPGENVDGHDFAQQAVDNGCAAILAERNPFSDTPPVPVFVVGPESVVSEITGCSPVERALRIMGSAWREAYAAHGKVVGLTGTAGKTTVKELLASVMSQHGPVSRTPGNFNSNIGLPLSLLNADPAARFWIMEAGISQAGDMHDLGVILRPDLALILNAGPGHTEGLGEKGTAFHKASLLKYLRPGGQGVVSADYPNLTRESLLVKPDAVLFSAAPDAPEAIPCRATYLGVKPDTEGRGLYHLWLDGQELVAETPFNSAFGAENVIAVAAAAHCLGVPAKLIAAGLGAAQLPRQRFARLRAGAWQVVDDSYNSNPLSAARMLQASADIAENSGEPLTCVLGEMRELGDIAAAEHEKLGQLVAGHKARAVFWAGGHFEDLLRGLTAGGFAGHVQAVDPSEPAVFLSALHKLHFDSGTILFKGSRANRLERLVTPFVNHFDAEAHHAV